MKRLVLLTGLLAALMTAGTASAGTEDAVKVSRMSYLDNGRVRLGIDLNLGGSITYISKSGSDVNLINSYDWGRQIQMSHYSGPVPFEPNGKKPNVDWSSLGWNPIQSGDCYGHRAKVLKSTNDGRSIYTKCIPMQWPLENEPGECTFENWITLKGGTIQVRCRMVNNRVDRTQYDGRDQELPAIYTNGPWWRLMTYDGDKPFTSDKLTQIPAVMPWKSWQGTENWAALVDDSGRGIGIWIPGVYSMKGGFAGKPGSGGTKDFATGYIAPLHQEIIDNNIDYTYSYVLIPGSLAEIREFVYGQKRPAASPEWIFSRDRQHWIYRDAVDTGWPISSELNVLLARNSPQIISPTFFARAEKNPAVYIHAAFKTGQSTARILWQSANAQGFDDKHAVSFPMTGDGKYRVYRVDLSASPEYSGTIIRLKLIPSESGAPDRSVRIKSIGFVKPKVSAVRTMPNRH